MALNKALKGAGIVPMCDVVVNHRCADKQDEHGVWNRFGCGQPTPAGLATALFARISAGGGLSSWAAERESGGLAGTHGYRLALKAMTGGL